MEEQNNKAVCQQEKKQQIINAEISVVFSPGSSVQFLSSDCFLLSLCSGDGANDVSMIQVADVGVGISGQEGMQVNKLNKQTVFVSMTEYTNWH